MRVCRSWGRRVTDLFSGQLPGRRPEKSEPAPNRHPALARTIAARTPPVANFLPPEHLRAAVLSPEGFAEFMAVRVCRVCGFNAPFGFDVSAKRGRPGRWYCGEHREGSSNG